MRGRSIRNAIVVMDRADFDGGAHVGALLAAVGVAKAGLITTVFAGSAGATALAVMSSTPHLEYISANIPLLLERPHLFAAAFTGLWSTRAQIAFRTLLMRFSTLDTVVHFHTWQKALSVSVVREAIRLGFSLVIHCHGFELVCPTGTFFNFPKQTLCRKTPMSLDCILSNCDSRHYSHKLWRVARHAIQDGAFPPLHDLTIIVGSHHARLKLQEIVGCETKMHVVAPPIVVSKEPFTASSTATLLFLGRLSREKGAVILARAASGCGLRVVFGGDGPERAVLFETDPAANITGWLNAAEVKLALLSARALVLPSLCLETYGRVVAEAASVGRPAIVPAESAASELVIPGVTGLTFKCGDVDSLREAILKLTDQNYARCLGEEAYRRYWVDPPNLSRHVEQLLQIYSEAHAHRC
jgi:glycosyltransferase involved in cell wall biosynthesis